MINIVISDILALKKKHNKSTFTVYMAHSFWYSCLQGIKGPAEDCNGPIDFYNSDGLVLLGCKVHTVGDTQRHPLYSIVEDLNAN